MRKFIVILLITIISMSTFTGCLDAREVTELSYIYSMGLDKGVENKLRLTVQLPVAKTDSQSSKQGSQQGGICKEEHAGIVTISVDCPVFFVGINMINSFLSRELTFKHTKYLVISENLATEGISKYINGIVRNTEIRRELYCIVTKGSARQFLKENVPIVTSSLTKMQEGLIKQSKNTGYFPVATYRNMLDSLKASDEEPIAILGSPNKSSSFQEGSPKGSVPFSTGGSFSAGEIPKSGGNKVEFFGTAIFSGDKMVGELNGDETRVLLMARNEFARGFFFIPDPKVPEVAVILDIRKQKNPTVKVKFQHNKPIVYLKVFLEADLASVQDGHEYENQELKPLLEKAMKDSIKKQLDRTIKKCQLLNSDVFKFGPVAAMHFKTIQDFEKYDWKKKFKDAEINTEVELVIRRSGTKVHNSKIFFK